MYSCACDRLERIAPRRVRRVMRYLNSPRARRVRLPVAVLCLIGGCLSFLPLLGMELIPIGLMLLAQDVKSLRRPAGVLTIWLLNQGERAQRHLRSHRTRWRAWRAVRRERRIYFRTGTSTARTPSFRRVTLPARKVAEPSSRAYSNT